MPIPTRRQRQKQVRLGNEVTLFRPTTGNNYGGLEPKYLFRELKGLVNVDSTDFPEGDKSGGWALTISAGKLVLPNPVPLSVLSAPLVAKIDYGCGGIMKTLLIDAWNSSIVVPSETLKVAVGYTEFGPFSYPGQTDLYPEELDISATVARVGGGASDGALLSRRLNGDSAGGLAPIFVDVPPFATAWGFANSAIPGPGSARYSEALIIGSGNLYDRVDDLYLDAMKESFAFRTLPPGAVRLRLTPAQNYAEATLFFRITF